jgi:mannose-6-phosphate isomerase-like protein (cupin superfamily)
VKVTRAVDAVPYAPPGHFGVESRRLQGAEAGGPDGFWVAESVYPPGSGAELTPTAGDTVYVVLEGELTVTAGDHGETLRPHDSVFIGAGEVRSLLNASDEPALLLVVLQPSRG